MGLSLRDNTQSGPTCWIARSRTGMGVGVEIGMVGHFGSRMMYQVYIRYHSPISYRRTNTCAEWTPK